MAYINKGGTVPSSLSVDVGRVSLGAAHVPGNNVLADHLLRGSADRIELGPEDGGLDFSKVRSSKPRSLCYSGEQSWSLPLLFQWMLLMLQMF